MIYFFSCNDAIKIGYTARNPLSRLSALQTGSADEITVLGVMAGGKPEECALHDQFADHRLQGEWFRVHDDLIEYIQANACATSDYVEPRKASIPKVAPMPGVSIEIAEYMQDIITMLTKENTLLKARIDYLEYMQEANRKTINYVLENPDLVPGECQPLN